MTTTTVERAEVEPARRDDASPGRLATSRRRAARALRGMTARRTAFRLVMALFIVLIAASYAVPLWFQLQGDRLLVVTSGSMEPEIGVGSAVVVRPITEASQLRVGQVVTFWPVTAGSDQGSTMETHRIVSLVNVNRRAPGTHEDVRDASGNVVTDPFIQTKGDGNESPDANLTPVTQVRGIVRDVHPGWGYLLAWAHSGIGRLLLFGPPLLMLLVSELFSRVPERWQRASWNRTLLAIRSREAAAGGPLARTTPEGDGVRG